MPELGISGNFRILFTISDPLRQISGDFCSMGLPGGAFWRFLQCGTDSAGRWHLGAIGCQQRFGVAAGAFLPWPVLFGHEGTWGSASQSRSPCRRWGHCYPLRTQNIQRPSSPKPHNVYVSQKQESQWRSLALTLNKWTSRRNWHHTNITNFGIWDLGPPSQKK